ncbi:glycosyltransferase family 2 protein [Flagelloscypha sp. PMI_526]|nr:glycosyltransferase family 2 protein [Flagelloscypha sp. PMI_526]
MIADKYPEEVYGNTASDGTSPHPIQFPSNAGFYNHPFPQSSRESIISVESHWRRRQTVQRGITRRVKLTHGHFIVEYRVPTPCVQCYGTKVQNMQIHRSFRIHMRYTAATCDPDDFCPSNGLDSSSKAYTTDRLRFLLPVTSYNEDKTLYARTLHGVMLNVEIFVEREEVGFGGVEERRAAESVPGWKRIVVALVVDGLGAMDKGVLDLLATVGVYQDGVMKKQVDGKDTVAHIFEYTTQLSIDSKPQLILPSAEDRNNLVPVQIILVLKQQNQKKINSHRWVFNALGKQLQPESCILLDAGTKPGYKSIYHLWLAFYHNPHLGGCCGEIFGMLGSYNHKALLNPLVAAQNFEYKLSNILDKPLESTFGYVSVLPGAFSAYRYRAILGRPLEQYFRGDHSLAERLGERGVNGMDIFTKNMFLAEDRILCFELAAKEGEKWTLGYVKASTAETDVPESAAELISQRRRWLNGSFAAGIYSLVHFYRFYYSGHGIIRMTAFHFQALYNILNIFFSWFALANLWLTFSIIIELLPQQGVVIGGNRAVIHWVNSACEWIYLGTLGLQFLLALGNRPKSERRAYTAAFYIFAIFSAYLLVCSLWLTGKVLVSLPAKLEQRHSIKDVLHAFIEPPLGPLVAALLSTFGFYLIGSLLFWDMGHMVHSFGQYLLVAMSFTNVLNVYAFCNLHDVSWGTKGSDKADSLPSISSSSSAKDDEPSVLDTTKVQEDVDASFRDTVARALSAPISSESGRSEKPTADDQNKTFRTHFVSAWLLTNVLLVLAVNNLNGWLDIDDPAITAKVIADFGFTYRERRNVYFAVLLYGTAALSGVRFLGSVCFWAKNAFIGRCRRS